MSVKSMVRKQYQQIVNMSANTAKQRARPAEGWIATVRKALGMSAAALARRMGKSRALISQTEKAEVEGAVTLKKMARIAEAMNCKFVYAIVPNTSIEDILFAQAQKKAKLLVERSSLHMALEDQVLGKYQIELEIDRLAKELLQEMPADFWKDSL